MWENNSESTTVMKKISFLEKDIALRKNLVQKAEDVEVLFPCVEEDDFAALLTRFLVLELSSSELKSL